MAYRETGIWKQNQHLQTTKKNPTAREKARHSKTAHRNREKERRDSGRRHKQRPIEDQSKPDRPSCKEPLNHRETTTEKVSDTEQKYHGTHGGVLHVLLCVRRNALCVCECVCKRFHVSWVCESVVSDTGRESRELTPGSGACIGSGENYMSGGRNIGYVMELAEHWGSTSHCTLKRTTSLERTHYLHLQERERTTSYTHFRARKREKEQQGGSRARRKYACDTSPGRRKQSYVVHLVHHPEMKIRSLFIPPNVILKPFAVENKNVIFVYTVATWNKAHVFLSFLGLYRQCRNVGTDVIVLKNFSLCSTEGGKLYIKQHDYTIFIFG